MADTSTISVRLIPTKQYTTPATGNTVTVNSTGTTWLFLNPAGTLLTLTVTLPASPTDQDSVKIFSSQAITTLTINGGTIIGALTTMAIGTFSEYTLFSDTSNWARTG
jgi:hypothetical protein